MKSYITTLKDNTEYTEYTTLRNTTKVLTSTALKVTLKYKTSKALVLPAHKLGYTGVVIVSFSPTTGSFKVFLDDFGLMATGTKIYQGRITPTIMANEIPRYDTFFLATKEKHSFSTKPEAIDYFLARIIDIMGGTLTTIKTNNSTFWRGYYNHGTNR